MTTTTPAIPARALYPVDEARQLLGGIGKTLLGELIRKEKLRKVKIGDRTFIPAESLNAYVRELGA
jgi:hypothetical protein